MQIEEYDDNSIEFEYMGSEGADQPNNEDDQSINEPDAIWGIIDYKNEKDLRGTQLADDPYRLMPQVSVIGDHQPDWKGFSNISEQVLPQSHFTELN